MIRSGPNDRRRAGAGRRKAKHQRETARTRVTVADVTIRALLHPVP